jgi:polar amino acid transport system permease protein
MTFDYAFALSTLPAFFKAVLVTLQVGVIAILTSLAVAVINTTVLVFKVPVIHRLVPLYVELARNTPLLIQLFFIYFALPSIGIRVSGFASAVIAMTFLGGAYLTEILHVILPQAGILSLPALFANFVFLLKETTVVSAVAVPEILYTTKSYIALYYKTYEMLAVMTGLCVLLFLPLSLLLGILERRLQHGQFGS